MSGRWVAKVLRAVLLQVIVGWSWGHGPSSSAVSSRQRLQHLLSRSPDSFSADSPSQGPSSSATTTQDLANSRWFSDEISPASWTTGRPAGRTYRDFYRVFYGSQEGVQHLRKTYGPTGLPQARIAYGIQQELDDVRQANEHFLKIRTGARCKIPRTKVVRVRDYYPDPTKEYLPRCTLLHRCGDESGCCDNDQFECVPRAVQEVTLHFYSLQLGKQGSSVGVSNSVEKLLFLNHTECECQPLNDLPRVQNDPQPRPQGRPPTHQHPAHHAKCRECPVPFYRRDFSDGRCSCDCFDRQKPCLRIKRGRDPLDDSERRCIDAGHCLVPECEYGPYEADMGRCPKKPEESNKRLAANKGFPTQQNHRWLYFERD